MTEVVWHLTADVELRFRTLVEELDWWNDGSDERESVLDEIKRLPGYPVEAVRLQEAGVEPRIRRVLVQTPRVSVPLARM